MNTTFGEITQPFIKSTLTAARLHYSYIQTEFNDKNKMIIDIISAYVAPLLKDINHPVLLQEWKLNTYAATYSINIDASMSKPSDRNKLILIIATCIGQPE